MHFPQKQKVLFKHITHTKTVICSAKPAAYYIYISFFGWISTVCILSQLSDENQLTWVFLFNTKKNQIIKTFIS